MTVHYNNAEPGKPGYWYADTPTMSDMEDFLYLAPRYLFYHFVVVGDPARVSPEWLASHPEYARTGGDTYDYVVSYSIDDESLGYLMDMASTPTEMFNIYLDDAEIQNSWLDIYRIELVDTKRWKYEEQ